MFDRRTPPGLSPDHAFDELDSVIADLVFEGHDITRDDPFVTLAGLDLPEAHPAAAWLAAAVAEVTGRSGRARRRRLRHRRVPAVRRRQHPLPRARSRVDRPGPHRRRVGRPPPGAHRRRHLRHALRSASRLHRRNFEATAKLVGNSKQTVHLPGIARQSARRTVAPCRLPCASRHDRPAAPAGRRDRADRAGPRPGLDLERVGHRGGRGPPRRAGADASSGSTRCGSTTSAT